MQDKLHLQNGRAKEFSYGALTHIGLKRKENQDAFILSPNIGQYNLGKGYLMAVADGMGGYKGGATASQLALSVLITEYYKIKPYNIRRALLKAFQKANEAVYTLAQDDKNFGHMGTTLTAVVLKGSCLYYAHVGDSRGYIIKKNSITQFTEDHSYVGSLLRAGAISPEEARGHPADNIITRAIGLKVSVDIDFFQKEICLRKGQYVLLCSDGLFKVVTDDEILHTVSTLMVPNQITKKLVEMANSRGGPDNTTVLVIRIEKSTGYWSLFRKAKNLMGTFGFFNK